MSDSGGVGLVDWVDLLAQELRARLDCGQAWIDTSNEADLPPVDFEAALQGASSEAERLILITSRRWAMRVYIARIGGPALLNCAEDAGAWQLVHTMAMRAGNAAHKVLSDRFGPQLPPGMRDLKNARRERLAAAALQARPASITDAAQAAGIPLRSFRRVIERKGKPKG
jgi:hypothetical protein